MFFSETRVGQIGGIGHRWRAYHGRKNRPGGWIKPRVSRPLFPGGFGRRETDGCYSALALDRALGIDLANAEVVA